MTNKRGFKYLFIFYNMIKIALYYDNWCPYSKAFIIEWKNERATKINIL